MPSSPRPFPRPSRPAAQASTRPTATDARCVVEPLEPRRLLAAAPAPDGPFPDDGGPDQASATYLGRLDEGRPTTRTARGALVPGEVQDVYRVKLDRETDLAVEVGGLELGEATRAYLMRHGEGRATPAAFATVDGGYRLTARLPAGSWYVGVFYDDPTGTDRPYTVAASGTPAPEPTLSRRAAQTAARLPAPAGDRYVQSGRVDAGRPSVYRFDVVDRRTVRVGVSGAGRLRADLTLFDAAGAVVGRGLPDTVSDGGVPDQSVTADLGPGAYFAAVASLGASGVTYGVNLLAVGERSDPAPPDPAPPDPAPPDPAPPDPAPPVTVAPIGAVLSRDAARSAYPLGEPGEFGGGLAGVVEGGTPAVYRIEVPRPGFVRAYVGSLDGDADLALFDGDGRVLYDSASDGTAAERVSGRLEPGSYFVHVRGRTDARTSYQLNVSADLDPPPPFAPTLTADAARSAARVRSPDPGDPIDGTVDGGVAAVYRVDLSRPGSIHADLRDPTGRAELTVFNEAGEVLVTDGISTFGNDVRASAQAGRHYVQVVAPSGDRVDFRLALDVELVPEARRGSTVVRGRFDGDDRDFDEAFPDRNYGRDLRRFDGFTFTLDRDAVGVDGEVAIDLHFSGGRSTVQIYRDGPRGDGPFEDGVAYDRGGDGRPSYLPLGRIFRDDARAYLDGRRGERFVVFVGAGGELDNVGDYTLTFGPGVSGVRELTDGELPNG